MFRVQDSNWMAGPSDFRTIISSNVSFLDYQIISTNCECEIYHFETIKKVDPSEDLQQILLNYKKITPKSWIFIYYFNNYPEFKKKKIYTSFPPKIHIYLNLERTYYKLNIILSLFISLNLLILHIFYLFHHKINMIFNNPTFLVVYFNLRISKC